LAPNTRYQVVVSGVYIEKDGKQTESPLGLATGATGKKQFGLI